MALLQSGPLNTGEYERSMPEKTPLPPGVYRGIVTKTEQKPTNGKDGNPGGIMVVVEFDITHPEEFCNRKFWDRFNIVNHSQQAATIGRECLADLGKACGIANLEDDEMLQGIEVILKLALTPAKAYVDRNGVQQAGSPQNNCLKYWKIGTDVEAAEAEAKERRKGAPAATPAAASSPAPQAARWPAKATIATAPAAATVATTAAPATQAATGLPATGAAPWKRNKQ